MADSFTANLNLRKPEVGAAADTWGGATGLNGDLDILDGIFAPAGGGTPVGLHVGTGKKLVVDGTGELDALLNTLVLRDATDPSKILKLSATTLGGGQTRTLNAPAADGVIATQEYIATLLANLQPTGTVNQGYYGTVAPSGWVFADGRTIGDAASGATNRANTDTQALFTRLWGFNDNARFPVTPSRGASAAADWAAHKKIQLPDHSGRTMAGRDDLSGTNRHVLDAAIPNSTIRGEKGGQATETATVTVDAVTVGPATLNAVTGDAAGGTPVQASIVGASLPATPYDHHHAVSFPNVTLTGTGSGSTAAANNAQPTIIVDVIIKL
jgi:hypothetical protein